MDKEAVKKSAAEWVENPYWAKYHDEAPTPECRAYVELEFYANDTDDEEAWETMDKLKNGFGIEEWKHLLKYSGCRGTFGGRRKAVRDRFALQGGTGDFP